MSERTLSATVLAIFKTSTMSRQTPTFDVTYGMADPRTAIKSFAIHTTVLTFSLRFIADHISSFSSTFLVSRNSVDLSPVAKSIA